MWDTTQAWNRGCLEISFQIQADERALPIESGAYFAIVGDDIWIVRYDADSDTVQYFASEVAESKHCTVNALIPDDLIVPLQYTKLKWGHRIMYGGTMAEAVEDFKRRLESRQKGL